MQYSCNESPHSLYLLKSRNVPCRIRLGQQYVFMVPNTYDWRTQQFYGNYNCRIILVELSLRDVLSTGDYITWKQRATNPNPLRSVIGIWIGWTYWLWSRRRRDRTTYPEEESWTRNRTPLRLVFVAHCFRGHVCDGILTQRLCYMGWESRRLLNIKITAQPGMCIGGIGVLVHWRSRSKRNLESDLWVWLSRACVLVCLYPEGVEWRER